MELKYFKPFWSFDVKSFEEWLSYMANEGIVLSKADFNLRIFTFEEGEPKKLTYRIQYLQSFDGSLPVGLLNDGWIVRTYNPRWYIAENIKGESDITVMPSRDCILKKNRIIFILL